MTISITLDIEDDSIPNRLPTEEEKRISHQSWLQCNRCSGLLFHAFKRTIDPDAPAYNADVDQCTIPMKVCMTCFKLSPVQ